MHDHNPGMVNSRVEPFDNYMEQMRSDYAQLRGVYAAAIREINARLTTLDTEFSFRNHREEELPEMLDKYAQLYSSGAALPEQYDIAKFIF